MKKLSTHTVTPIIMTVIAIRLLFCDMQMAPNYGS